MTAARRTVLLCVLPSGKKEAGNITQICDLKMYFSCGVDREVGMIYLNNEMIREAMVRLWRGAWLVR